MLNAQPESTCAAVAGVVFRNVVALKRGARDLEYRAHPWANRGMVAVALVDLVVVPLCGVAGALTDVDDRYNNYLWATTLCAAVLLFYVVLDAVMSENAVQLVVFNVGAAVFAARLWAIFLPGLSGRADDHHKVMEIAAMACTGVCQVVFLVLSVVLYGSFGRHVFYMVGAKEALVQRYLKYQVCLALVKGDVLFSTILVIAAGFYYDLPAWLLAGCVVVYFVSVYYSIAVLQWVRLERTAPVYRYCAASVVVPLAAIAGLVRIHLVPGSVDRLHTDAAAHYFGYDPASLGNGTAFEGLPADAQEKGDAALAVLTVTVVACVANRAAAIGGLIWVSKKVYGSGLCAALYQQDADAEALANETAATRPSPTGTGCGPATTDATDGGAKGLSVRLKAYGETPRGRPESAPPSEMSVGLLQNARQHPGPPEAAAAEMAE